MHSEGIRHYHFLLFGCTEIVVQYALHTLDFALTSQSSEPRGEDALGVSVGGRLLLVPAASFQPLVKEMIETYTTM